MSLFSVSLRNFFPYQLVGFEAIKAGSVTVTNVSRWLHAFLNLRFRAFFYFMFILLPELLAFAYGSRQALHKLCSSWPI